MAYEDHEVIHELSLMIPSQQITALVGPNGSGKSTLLKGLARLMKPTCGAVYLDSQEIHRLPTKQVAKRLAMLPQRPESPDGLTVRELVTFGRFPHQGFFGVCTEEDDAKIHQALEITGISEMADHALGELSGGQRQLAWVAMALAQDTRLLLLDEPTTFLDMSHQIEVLDVLKRLNQEHGRTIVMVLHDLNMAARTPRTWSSSAAARCSTRVSRGTSCSRKSLPRPLALRRPFSAIPRCSSQFACPIVHDARPSCHKPTFTKEFVRYRPIPNRRFSGGIFTTW